MKCSIYIKTWAVIAAIVLTSSCESYLIHDDLDGFWQVRTIENKKSGLTTDCEGNIYYSFQRNLVLLTYNLPDHPIGQTKEHYIAYFTHENDSIAMTDFRIYLDKNATQAPLFNLEKFGLYDIFNTFQVEKLNHNSLILDSDKTRIVMLKY